VTESLTLRFVRVKSVLHLCTPCARRDGGARYHSIIMITVTFWPILAAGIANVLIGWIWYHPKIFGSAWMRMSGITPEVAEQGKKRMPLMAFVAFLASMVVAYVMNYFGIAWGVYDWIGAVELGFWCWIGFAAPALLGSVLWEQKPLKLYLINALYWLVSFIVIAVVLVVGAQMLGTSYGPFEDYSAPYTFE